MARKVAVRETHAGNLWKIFVKDELVRQFDKIFLVMLGGCGGFGRVVKATIERYPLMRNKMEVLAVDFDMDDRFIDRDWGLFNLGADGVDGKTLREVVDEFGIPEGKFTKGEKRAIEDFVADNGTHQFVWGAGNNPLIGRLGFLYSQDAFTSFLYDYFEDLSSRVLLENVLVLIASGTGGGTGYGIAEEATPIITNMAREMGVNGASGVVPLFFGWRAYTPIVFTGTGEITSLADLMWKRSMSAWKEQKNSFFVASTMGPDSLLAMIQIVLEKARVLNNSHEQGGYRNFVLQFDEVTKWTIQRFAGFEISRGITPRKPKKIWKIRGLLRKSLELQIDVASMRTVGELGNAMHYLREDVWTAQLSALLREEGLEPGEVTNYGDREELIANQLHQLQAIVSQLTRMSGSTGLYLMPDERDLVESVHALNLADVQRGRAMIHKERATLVNMIPDSVQVISRDSFPFGNTTVLGELGTNGPKPKVADEIVVPSYRSISREEQHEIEKAVVVSTVRRKAANVRRQKNEE